ncbi:SDR family NAD(P)-dependent oxidoreductase [Alcanivorax sp. IO_7]|nr:SDR family NAD(P)-dependent oxidoreductase [Alcanivorax sp. IO_7]
MEANLGDWQAMVDVNLTGVMATIHAALPYLVGSAQAARGVADVVTVSSIAGRKVPGPVGSVYAATKHGVGAFAKGYGRSSQSSTFGLG